MSSLGRWRRWLISAFRRSLAVLCFLESKGVSPAACAGSSGWLGGWERLFALLDRERAFVETGCPVLALVMVGWLLLETDEPRSVSCQPPYRLLGLALFLCIVGNGRRVTMLTHIDVVAVLSNS